MGGGSGGILNSAGGGGGGGKIAGLWEPRPRIQRLAQRRQNGGNIEGTDIKAGGG